MSKLISHKFVENLRIQGAGVVDLNIAVINPYSGGLGELMTMVEPSIVQAIQESARQSTNKPGQRDVWNKSFIPKAPQTHQTQYAFDTTIKNTKATNVHCFHGCQDVEDSSFLPGYRLNAHLSTDWRNFRCPIGSSRKCRPSSRRTAFMQRSCGKASIPSVGGASTGTGI